MPGPAVTCVLPPADREFIEARRRALKRFINLVARHPPFSEDAVLKLFLSFSGPVSTRGAWGGPGAPGSLCCVVSVRSLCSLPWFGPNVFCFHGVAVSRAVSLVAWEALGRACWQLGRSRGFSAGPRGLKLLRGRGLHGWGLASGPAAPDVDVCALRKGQGGLCAVAELQLDVCPGRCGPSVPVTPGRRRGGRILL